MKTMINKLAFLCYLLVNINCFAQTFTQSSDLTDGKVTSMVTDEKNGKIYLAGTFSIVGKNQGRVILTNGSTLQINAKAKPINSYVRSAIGDSKGGFFVILTRQDRDSPQGLVHLLEDGSVDSKFVADAIPEYSTLFNTPTMSLKDSLLIVSAVGGLGVGDDKSHSLILAFSTQTGKINQVLTNQLSLQNKDANITNPEIRAKGIIGSFIYGNTLYVSGCSTDGNGGNSTNCFSAFDLKTKSWKRDFDPFKKWTDKQSVLKYSVTQAPNKMAFGGGKLFLSGYGYGIWSPTPDFETLYNPILVIDTANGTPLDWNIRDFIGKDYGSITSIVTNKNTLFVATSLNNGESTIYAFDLKNLSLVSSWKKPSLKSPINGISANDNFVFFHGNFIEINNIPRKYYASLDAKTGELSGWNPNILERQSDATLAVNSDNSTLIGGHTGWYDAAYRKGIVAFDIANQKITDLNFETTPIQGWSGLINNIALSTTGDSLFVGMETQGSGALRLLSTKTGKNLPFAEIKVRNGNAIASVKRLKIDKNLLYSVGSYELVDGINRNGFSIIDLKTNKVLPFDAQIEARSYSQNAVNNLFDIVTTDSTIFISGNFDKVGGLLRNNIVCLSKKDYKPTSWSPNPNIDARQLAIFYGVLYAHAYNGAIEPANNWYGVEAFDLKTGKKVETKLFSEGNLHNIATNGSFLFFNGQMSVTPENGNAKNLLMLNKNLVPASTFDLNSTTRFSFTDFVSYGSLNYVTVENRQGGFNPLMGSIIPQGITSESTVSYFPLEGGKGDVTINFYGKNIGNISSIIIADPNRSSDIVIATDTLLRLVSSNHLQARFNTRNLPWNATFNGLSWASQSRPVVTLVYKDGNRKVVGSFSFSDFQRGVTSEIIGPSTIRLNRANKYSIVVTNESSIDKNGILVWLFVPNNAKVTFKEKFSIGKLQADTATYAVVDTVFGVVQKSKSYCFMIYLEANSSRAIDFDALFTQPSNTSFYTFISGPVNDNPVSFKNARIDNTQINEIPDCLMPTLKCLNTIFTTVLTNFFGSAISCGASIPLITTSNNNVDLLSNVSFAMANCLAAASIITPVGAAVKITSTIAQLSVGGYSVYSDCQGLFGPSDGTSCSGGKKPNPKSISAVGSIDPNDKIGTNGVGNKHFIKGNNSLTYNIRFENQPTATAPAQVVKVVDTLDIKKLNINTLQLNSFYFGDKKVNVPAGKSSYSADVDLRPQQNLIVNIDTRLDEKTGILTTNFTAIDPKTFGIVQDPLVGFLPPNKKNSEGEGGIIYTLQARADLADETIISNKAYIYFDENQAIATPAWVNIIDKFTPESQVQPLAQVQYDTTFIVKWSGNDKKGSGIRFYDVYVSTNGKGFKLYLSQTQHTSSTFRGKMDSTYAFFSVATDSLGYVEVMPSKYDAITRISRITAVEPTIFDAVLCYPNPTQEDFFIEIPEGLQLKKLDIYNSLGQSVWSNDRILPNTRNYNINVSGIVKGVYLVYFETNKGIFVKKLAIQ